MIIQPQIGRVRVEVGCSRRPARARQLAFVDTRMEFNRNAVGVSSALGGARFQRGFVEIRAEFVTTRAAAGNQAIEAVTQGCLVGRRYAYAGTVAAAVAAHATSQQRN